MICIVGGQISVRQSSCLGDTWKIFTRHLFSRLAWLDWTQPAEVEISLQCQEASPRRLLEASGLSWPYGLKCQRTCWSWWRTDKDVLRSRAHAGSCDTSGYLQFAPRNVQRGLWVVLMWSRICESPLVLQAPHFSLEAAGGSSCSSEDQAARDLPPPPRLTHAISFFILCPVFPLMCIHQCRCFLLSLLSL